MSKFYYSGCKEENGQVWRVSDEEAEFFTVYERRADGTSMALEDFDNAEEARRVVAETSGTGDDR